MSLFQRAAASSVVVQGLQRVIAHNATCTAVIRLIRRTGVVPWVRETRRRVRTGLRGDWSPQQERRTVEQMDALVSGSRIARLGVRCVTAPLAGWRSARARTLLDPILSVDLPAKIRLGGVTIVVAVLTHVVIVAVLGLSVQWLGWSVRVGLLIAGVLAAWRPEPIVAAWRDKTGL